MAEMPAQAGGRLATMLRNATSNYVGFAISALVTLLLTPFLLGRLGDTTFGVWMLMVTVLAYFQLLELGIAPSVIRHVSRRRTTGDQEGVERVIGSAAFLLVLISVLTVPFVWLCALHGPSVFDQPPQATAVFSLAIWLTGAGAVVAYFRRLGIAVFEGEQRFDLLNLCAATTTLASAIASVVVVLLGHGLIALVLVLCGEMLFATVLQLIVIRRAFGLRVSPFLATRAHIRELSDYSVFAWLIDCAVVVSHRIDTVVIGICLPMAAIAHYTISTKISGLLEKLTNPLIDTFFPLASELDESAEPAALRRLLTEGTRVSILMITPGLIIVGWYGGDVIRWWVGAEYIEPCLAVLHVFLAVIFLEVFESTASRILLGTGQVRFDATVSLATAAANLTISLLLVRHLGVLGVALGTLLPSLVTTFLLSVPYTCKVTGTPIVAFHVRVLAPTLVIAAVSLPVLALTDDLIANRVVACVLHSFLVTGVAAAVAWKVLDWRRVLPAR